MFVDVYFYSKCEGLSYVMKQSMAPTDSAASI